MSAECSQTQLRDDETPPDVRVMTRRERELFTETATTLPVDFHS